MFNFGYSNNSNSNTGNSGGGLFGNKPAAGGFSFGGNTNNTPNQGGGLFSNNPTGATTGQGSAGGGLFGSQNTNTATNANGSLFGGANNSQTGTTGLFASGNPPSTTTGSMFSSNNNQNNMQSTNTGIIFGNNNSQNNNPSSLTGLFSSQPASGTSTFGQSSTSSGGLFGQANASINNTDPGAGGLFGSTNNPGMSTANRGLFGQNNTSSTSNTGGLFGQNNSANTSIGKPGGMFGQGSNTTTTIGNKGGIFGQGNTSTGTGLFGQSAPAPATGTTGLFGQNNLALQDKQQASSFFAPAIKSSQPSFAWSQQPSATMNNLQEQQGQQQQGQQQQQQLQQQQVLQQQYAQQQNNYPQQIQEQILKCKESWDPSNQRSKLRTFVYNKCNETEAMLYTKPPNVAQEDWDHALLHKPSANVIPIEVKGFEDLNQRHNLQREHVAQARIILSQILEKLTNVSQRHELDTATRILKAQARNSKIQHRIMKLASQIAVLKCKGLPLSVQEETLVAEFRKLLETSNDPAGLGKNNELWARLAVLKERAKTLSNQLDSTLVVIAENGGSRLSSTNTTEDQRTDSDERRVDEEVVSHVNKIADILMNQQRGLIYLNEVLEKDTQLLEKYVKK